MSSAGVNRTTLMEQLWAADGDLTRLNNVTDDAGNKLTLESSPKYSSIGVEYDVKEIHTKTPGWFLGCIASLASFFHQAAADKIVAYSMKYRTIDHLRDLGFYQVVGAADSETQTTIQKFFHSGSDSYSSAKQKVKQAANLERSTKTDEAFNEKVCPATHQPLTQANAILLKRGNRQIILSRGGISKILAEGESFNQNLNIRITREDIINGELTSITRQNFKLANTDIISVLNDCWCTRWADIVE